MAITRTDGTKLINKVFSELDTARAHYSNEGFDFIPGMKELRDAVTIIMKLRKTSDYNYWLNNLDISEYEKYFKKVTELAAIFSSKQASKMQSSDFLKLRDLASAFGKTSKYEKRLEIINTFSLDDLQNWDKDYPEKEGLLIQLLDKWFMNDDGKDTINKFLSSFSQRDKEKFIEKTITNPEILELLLKKINMGDEKNNLLKTFIDFGNNTNIDKNEYEIPKGKVFNASFVDKKMYLNLMKPVPGEDNVYELDKQIQLQTPFTNVSFYYGDDNRITIPAISLIGRNYDDILYDDFYKNNIDLKELSPEEKEALFNEFVQHYLGKAFIAEYLSNPLGLLKSIGITIAIGILLLFASEALTIGIAIAGSAYGAIVSALSLRSGLSLLGGANEEKQNAENIKNFKMAANHTAEAMLKIGVNGVMLITSLIQFGEACWKGGKLYYKNKQLTIDKPMTSLNKSKYSKTPDPSQYAKNASDIIENHNNFKWDENTGKWYSPDKKRIIWYEKGWKYSGENGIIEEFTVIKSYKQKIYYKTSTVNNKSFMQAHHGIKSEWALNNKYLKIYYNKNEAPCLLLRDSCKGTPHQAITLAQAKRDINVSYAVERMNFKNDCKMLGIPDSIMNQFLQESDIYFGNIYEKMIADKKIPKPIIDSIFKFDFKTRTNK